MGSERWRPFGVYMPSASQAHGYKPLNRLTIALLLLLLGATPLRAEVADLPDLGDRSALSFSAIDERIIGRAMVRGLYYSGALLDDPQLDEYLQQLSTRLLSAAGFTGGGYRFYLVDDPSINAFAMPGGHIAVHSGLLLKSESEDELAAVLAHEIAHVSQHHLARRYESLQGLNTRLNIAMLAAILLSASHPQLAEAAIASGLGGQQQAALGYSRSHEHEADRVGIQLLADAGFDPHSMAGFFRKLQEASRYSIGVLPEFLSTHPVNSRRIVDAEQRADALTFHAAAARGEYHTAYLRAKARLSALTSHAVPDRLQRLQQRAETHADEYSRYAYALALVDDGRAGEALPLLVKLVAEHPQRIAYLDALARCQVELKHGAAALDLYRRGLALYPDNRTLGLGMAEAQLKLGKPAEARQLLNRLLRVHSDDAAAYRLLARSEGALSNPAGANIALAEHLYLYGDTIGAIQQLKNAQRLNDLDFYQQERIDSRLEVLEREAVLERSWDER